MAYFEEHDGPWLFRRVHADIARLDTLPSPSGTVADVLVETPAPLPALAPGRLVTARPALRLPR
jgi:hypothetical protein